MVEAAGFVTATGRSTTTMLGTSGSALSAKRCCKRALGRRWSGRAAGRLVDSDAGGRQPVAELYKTAARRRVAATARTLMLTVSRDDGRTTTLLSSGMANHAPVARAHAIAHS